MFWRTRTAAPWLIILPLCLFFWLALNSMVSDSPTMDEQNHLARGVALLASGDPRFSLEHPPLINVLSAAPVLALLDVRVPFDHPSWEWREGWYAFASELLWVANADVTRMIFLARLPVVFLTIGLALVGYRFALALWHSRAAGLAASTLLLTDPNILAHGRYVTTDAGATTFILFAVFACWRLWQRPASTWRDVGLAALALGLAFSSKLSALTFVPILVILALLPQAEPRWSWQPIARRLLSLIGATALSMIVVWAVYAFQWGRFAFQSAVLEPFNSLSGPMPTYWAGIEQILTVSEAGRSSFLLGQFSDSGFLAYFPVALGVKTPLSSLALFVVAAWLLIRSTVTRRPAVFLLLAALLYLAIAMQSGLNIGYRHLLPMLPFLYLVGAGLTRWRPPQQGNSRLKALTGRRLLVVAIAGVTVATLIIHPHYLSFFNLPSGGPSHGAAILSDSNIDWGQDLIRLQRWLSAEEAGRIKLSWFGTADPAYYGIDYEPLPGLPRHFDLWWDPPFDPEFPEPGLYAISVSNLTEPPFKPAEKTVFAWFRASEPVARIGYSINLYRVP